MFLAQIACTGHLWSVPNHAKPDIPQPATRRAVNTALSFEASHSQRECRPTGAGDDVTLFMWVITCVCGGRGRIRVYISSYPWIGDNDCTPKSP
jgi:hypothetical protein